MDPQIKNNLATRSDEWKYFSSRVLNHIEKYTVPQYGDMNLENPEKGDQMQSASLDDVKMNLLRYVNRLNSNARGYEEAIRDLYKIAHYACILYGKYERKEIHHETTPEIKVSSYSNLISDENLEEIHKYIQSGKKEIKIKII